MPLSVADDDLPEPGGNQTLESLHSGQLALVQPPAANGRHALDQKLLVSLASGSEIRQVAHSPGSPFDRDLRVDYLSPAKKPEVPHTHFATAGRMTHLAVGRLVAASSAAVNTLVSLLDDPDSRVRHAAAKTILEQGIKQRELNELSERFGSLEEKFKCSSTKSQPSKRPMLGHMRP